MIGRTLSHYKVLEKIGEGGMGEVYLAKDTKLDRQVAIKVLPKAFSENEERLARFGREARLLASLNHPNIAAIHQLEESDGVHFLALEYIPGETLAERIRRGPIPVDEALPLFKQIAEGLEAAHENGVIHRDLKPANIKITPQGQVKVLDFGLAKALSGSPQDPTESLTLTQQSTEEGVILGTISYMSPEQARGRAVDKRTDVWAFGCVLYEALSGRKAFKGDTVSDTIVVILQREPQWEVLPDTVPRKLRDLLDHCIRKDSRSRLHDIADARIEIEDVLSEAPESAPDLAAPPPSRRLHTFLMIALGLLVGALTTVGVLRSPLYESIVRKAPAGLVRFAVDLPPGESLAFKEHCSLSLSPQGTTLVQAVERADGVIFYRRDLNTIDNTVIEGTEVGFNPFFSPDGSWLGFFSQEGETFQLKRLSFDGGVPVVFHQEDSPPYGGASWSSRNTVIFPNARESGLYEISSDGGTRSELTQLKEQDAAHRWPVALPETEAIVFTAWNGQGSFDDAHIVVQTLENPQRKTLIEGGTFARYASTGHLVYARNGSMMAVAFDMQELEITGKPVRVLDGLMMDTSTGAAHFAFSNNGTLAYVPGRAWDGQKGLSRVDLEEPTEPVTVGRFPLSGTFRLSPDGRRLALTLAHDDEEHLWIHDIASNHSSKLTNDGRNRDPIWSPDGTTIVYRSSRGEADGLFSTLADGSESPQQIATTGEEPVPGSWSPDGKMLAYWSLGSETGLDIWMLDWESQEEPVTFRQTEFNERYPAFSPDGVWLAFVSDETGNDEVYVAAVAKPDELTRISREGGHSPRWSPDGGRIFYRVADELVSVSFQTAPEFAVGEPQVLLSVPSEVAFDLSPDARYALIAESEEKPRQAHVILNWFEELERLVPTK
jgi:serine/threonine-protein kinase